MGGYSIAKGSRIWPRSLDLIANELRPQTKLIRIASLREDAGRRVAYGCAVEHGTRGAWFLTDRPLKDALGPSGVPSDPDALAWVARSVGAVYRRAVAEGTRWLHTTCAWDEMRAVITMAPPLVDDLLSKIEALPGDTDNAVSEGLRRQLAGETNGPPIVVGGTVTIPENSLATELIRLLDWAGAHGWPDEELSV